MLTWPNKDPDEVLDYVVDWTTRLDVAETISTSVFTIPTGNVTIQSQSFSTKKATLWLAGGTDGTACVISNIITTSAGRTYDEAVRLRVRSKEPL